MEDAFGDPDTPVAKKSIDFHHPLPGQLDKIMHEIKGGIYHEDSGTHSDMDSLASETDVKMMKEEYQDGECYQMVDGFSIEVGGFAITCASDERVNAKKSDYMYEIGTKHDKLLSETKPIETSSVAGIQVGNEVKTSEDFDSPQEAPSLPPPAPPTEPTVRPRSAPTFSSLQQRRSSRIQLKSLSTTALPSHQPVAAAENQEKKLTYYKCVSMSDQFPKWLYSEVVKAGLQFSKPGFLRSNSSSSLSSSSSDPESNMDDGTATDSSDQQEMMQTEAVAADSGKTLNAISCVSSATQESMEQFDHYGAICYLWRGMLCCITKTHFIQNLMHYRMEGHVEELLAETQNLISNPFVHDCCFLISFCT